MKTRLILGFVIATLGAASLVVWLMSPTERPNVLLITVDTLRADHLGTYGYTRPTSPTIDAIARDGVVFDRAFSQASLSGPSHATMMTGLDPPAHGVQRNGKRLEDDYVTLAEILGAAGYDTGMFVSHPLVGAQFGLAQGFDTVREFLVDSHMHDHTDRERRGDATRSVFDAATEWVSWARAPFFMWLHVQDVHESYEPVDPYDRMFLPPPATEHDLRCVDTVDAHRKGRIELTDAERDYVVALYDGEIAQADAGIGRVLDALRSAGHDSSTIVVLTADHGEMLFDDPDRREQGHGAYGTDAVLRVPLIVRDPRSPCTGCRVEPVVGLVDLARTIVDLAGLRAPETVGGASLTPLIAGEVAVVHERLHSFNWYSDDDAIYTVRTDRTKLVCRGRLIAWECRLFDLRRDPGEQRDVSGDATHSREAERLAASFDRWLEAGTDLRRRYKFRAPGADPPAARTRELLRRAGYLETE